MYPLQILVESHNLSVSLPARLSSVIILLEYGEQGETTKIEMQYAIT